MELNGRKCFKKGWSTSGEKSPADLSKRNSPVTLTVVVLVGRSLACSGIPGNGDQNTHFFPSNQRLNSCPMHRKSAVLTTRPPGKYLKMLH